jgi:hypothetical protein
VRARPGFYLRVLQEGEVGPGDEIVKAGEGKERMTVAEINALLYSPDHARDRLKRALRIEALSPGWRLSFDALLQSQLRELPHLPKDDANTGPLVSFARSGIAAHWKASEYQSNLEPAEVCDVPVRWSCRTGVCHSCKSGLVSGPVVYGPEPLEKAADANLLVCCSQQMRDIVIDL